MAWIVRSNRRRTVLSHQCESRMVRPTSRESQGNVLNHDTGSLMQRRGFLKQLAASVAIATGGVALGAQALATDTIKIGVLHSVSGTMAISETVRKDVARMAIDEINGQGRVLGQKL